MHTFKQWRLALGLITLAAASSFAANSAQAAYPDKPIRLVVAFPPGGVSDITARIVAPKLGQILGQSVIIENRAGAAGNVGAQAVSIADPDGYEFLVTTTSFAVNPALWGKDAGYDARSFVPVAVISTQPNVIVVNHKVPAKTLAELKTLSTKQTLAYATPGTGTTPALTADNLFHVLWKAKSMTSIPYRGAGPAAVAVLGGETPVASMAPAAVVQYIKTGQVVPLAVSSRERIPSMPNVPTLYELGYQSIQDYTWTAVLAPKGTPPAAIKAMNDAINKAIAMPDVKTMFDGQALTGVGGTPEQFRTYLNSELTRWAQVVKATGAKRE